MKLNGLDKNFKVHLLKRNIVDFKQVDSYGDSPFMYALKYNKSDNLNLSNEQFDYLIQNSDLNQMDKYGWSPLMIAFRWSEEENLNLSHKQFDYLIKNSDLKKVDNESWSPLMFALTYNKSENLNLSKEHWKYLINNADLSLIIEEKQLMALKKIQLKIINEELLSKIEIKVKINKNIKI